MNDYRAFLEAKVRLDRGCGFEVDPAEINPLLKPHVRLGVQWALGGGAAGSLLEIRAAQDHGAA